MAGFGGSWDEESPFGPGDYTPTEIEGETSSKAPPLPLDRSVALEPGAVPLPVERWSPGDEYEEPEPNAPPLPMDAGGKPSQAVSPGAPSMPGSTPASGATTGSNRWGAPAGRACPPGSWPVNGVCMPLMKVEPNVKCKHDEMRVGDKCVRAVHIPHKTHPAKTCPPGQVLVGDNCVALPGAGKACPPGKMLVGDNCVALPGSAKDPHSKCPKGFVMSPHGHCIRPGCPAGHMLVDGVCRRSVHIPKKTCPSGQILVGGSCVKGGKWGGSHGLGAECPPSSFASAASLATSPASLVGAAIGGWLMSQRAGKKNPVVWTIAGALGGAVAVAAIAHVLGVQAGPLTAGLWKPSCSA